ncbi:MAG: hypothetical protein K2M22_05615 [Lachnospiraceae bacterium]|nr:hypothetical protein [Lachnospiraceae bacterium]MDE7176943.1 hypothetical protein [Lachnospiraceae bacterium]
MWRREQTIKRQRKNRGQIRQCIRISGIFGEMYKRSRKSRRFGKEFRDLPVSHQNMTASWKALGARVVNEQWIYDENGNCGFGSGMYVTNSNPSSGSNVQDKVSEKKGQRKNPSVQEHYEKRKLLREQFEERLAEKEHLKDQMAEEMKEEMLKKSVLSKEQNAGRFIERYEANILKS